MPSLPQSTAPLGLCPRVASPLVNALSHLPPAGWGHPTISHTPGIGPDEYAIAVPDTTIHISGIDWWMREDNFLPQFFTLGNLALPWGHRGILGVCVTRQAMRDDGNLAGTVFIRFASRDLAEAFMEEFDHTRCSGRLLECNHARQEMSIPPRSQWGPDLELGKPRFKEDCWSMPPEANRPGVNFWERPDPRDRR